MHSFITSYMMREYDDVRCEEMPSRKKWLLLRYASQRKKRSWRKTSNNREFPYIDYQNTHIHCTEWIYYIYIYICVVCNLQCHEVPWVVRIPVNTCLFVVRTGLKQFPTRRRSPIYRNRRCSYRTHIVDTHSNPRRTHAAVFIRH